MQTESKKRITILLGIALALGAALLVVTQLNSPPSQPEEVETVAHQLTETERLNEVSALVSQSSKVDASSIEVTPIDFDGDGENEYVVYYHQILSEPVEWNSTPYDWNGAFKMYRYSEGTWHLLYQDEGSMKANMGVTGKMEGDDFFEAVDLDEDGVTEAVITISHEGTGGTKEQYILKWDGEALVRPDIVQSLTTEELKASFLQPGELLGRRELYHIAICPPAEGGSWCESKSGSPNAIAKIINDFVYRDGDFVAVNYVREDYPAREEMDESVSTDADWPWVTVGGGEGAFPDASETLYRVHLPDYLSDEPGLVEIWQGETLLAQLDTTAVHSGDGPGDVWTAFTTDTESGSETRIYFYDGAGCGGCVWGSTYYVAIDSTTQEVELREMAIDETFSISKRDYMATSPSGKLVASVLGVRGTDPQEVWVYNLETESGMEIFRVPEGYKVSGLMSTYPVWYLFLSWEGETLHIQPAESAAMESYDWDGQEDLSSPPPGTEGAFLYYTWTSEEGLMNSAYY